jgi:hypothetical protein
MVNDMSAVEAWAAMTGSAAECRCVANLAPGNHKATVVELEVLGEDRSVVAKRAPSRVVALEATVYNSVLPAVGLRSLGCLGTVHSAERGFSWIFLEKAVGVMLDVSDPDHLSSLTRWIAVLHQRSVGMEPRGGIPFRSPESYESRISEERSALVRLQSSTFDVSDREVIDDLVGIFDDILHEWPRYAASLNALEPVFIHGDLAPENVWLGTAGTSEQRLFVMDWEKSGIGPAALDLARLDPVEYARALGLSEQRGFLHQLRLQQTLGRMLREATRRLHRKTPRKIKAHTRRLVRDLTHYRQLERNVS